MRRLLPSALAIVALVAACIVGNPGVRAQTVTTISAPFSLSAAGQSSSILNLVNSQGNCSAQVDNVGSGTQLTAQSTSDISPSAASPWNTATNIGTNGVISSFGTYTGSVSATTNGGLTGFRVTLTALSSGGPVTGKITCSTAQSSTSVTIQGTVPISLPTCAAAPNAPCVQVTGPVTVTCTNCSTTTTGSTQTILTSASATACTAIKTTSTVLRVVFNSGPQMTVFPQFYNDNGTCAAGDLIYGDGATLVLGAGQVVTFDTPESSALSYKLSGALTSNLVVTTTP